MSVLELLLGAPVYAPTSDAQRNKQKLDLKLGGFPRTVQLSPGLHSGHSAHLWSARSSCTWLLVTLAYTMAPQVLNQM
jgi:hypothetical protein